MKFMPRSESTRQFIIEATARLFNTKGYEGTSMTDITEATGLTKGSVYGNFENKEAVALAVFEYNSACMSATIRKKMEGAVTNKDKLLTYATLFSSTGFRSFPDGGCPLANMAIEADDTNEAFRKKVAEEFVNWKKSIATLIQNGIIAKEFRQDVQVEKNALSILALIEGSILLTRATRNPHYADSIMDTLKDLIHNMEVKKAN
ncbi:MAG: TetR/AcrR family transcriptional regulator [Chitinophagaceae bacterium]